MISNEFTKALGLHPNEDILTGEHEGYRYSYSETGNGYVKMKGLLFTFPYSLNNDIRKRVQKLIGKTSVGLQKFALTSDSLFVMFPFRSLKLRNDEAYNNECLRIRDAAVSAFRTIGLEQPKKCFLCGRTEEEDMMLKPYKGFYVPVHQKCAEELVSYTINQLSKEKPGNLPLSIILAIVGGFVGLIPTIILIFAIQTIFALLYALIPLGAAFGYKLGKAPRNKAMIITIIGVSLLIVMGYDFLIWSMASGSTIQELLANSDFISEAGTSLLFLAIGIYISWKYITATSEKEINEVRKLK